MFILRAFLWGLTVTFVSVECGNSPKPLPFGAAPNYPDDYCTGFQNNEEFDFIVVGSGPAGSALSRRLAEVPEYSILLLEAGENPDPSSDIPENAGKLPAQDRWQFTSSNNENLCFGFPNASCPIIPGKNLGGSSTVNFMMAVRGNKDDFDEWSRLGNTGWSYEEVLPYFRKIENFQATAVVPNVLATPFAVDEKYHGVGGPITINNFPLDVKSEPLRDNIILSSVLEHDIPLNFDVNGRSQMGITNIPGYVNGLRYNVAKGYLNNVPTNLKVCKLATVYKVLLENKTAVGVEFRYRGNSQDIVFNARAKKEVILSAGAFNSGPLLERSGIGRRDILERAGVEVVHESPEVGENLRDHFSNGGCAFNISYNSIARSHNPYTIRLTSLTAFVNTLEPSSTIPDIQYIFQTADSATSQTEGSLYYAGTVLRQEEPGWVHITQAEDPTVSPDIRINLYNGLTDQASTVKACRLAREVMKSVFLAQFNPVPLVIVPCRIHPFNSDEEILCQASYNSVPIYHTAGVTGMGPPGSNAVVDPQLRVYGIDRLRVADGGIFPYPVHGNSEFATLMVGEKAADLIKEDHSSSSK